MATGTQDYVGDVCNDEVLVSVNGASRRCEEATVSVFDLRPIAAAARPLCEHLSRRRLTAVPASP